MKRVYDLVNLSLLFLIGFFVYSSYPRLPARIPMHFNMAGRPDRWDGRGGIVVLAVLALAMTTALYAVTWLTPRLTKNSRYVNIPRKQEFLRLSAEKQESYWAVFKEFFAALALAINLLFYLILRGMVRIAMGTAGLLPFRVMWPAFGLMALILVYYTWRLMVLPGKLIRGEE